MDTGRTSRYKLRVTVYRPTEKMCMRSAKAPNELAVLQHVHTRVDAMGGSIDDIAQLTILAAVTIKAEGERKKVPGPIRRAEVGCLLFRMLEIYGNDALRAMFPSPQSLEDFVEVLFQLNKLGSDVHRLLRAVERGNDRAETQHEKSPS